MKVIDRVFGTGKEHVDALTHALEMYQGMQELNEQGYAVKIYCCKDNCFQWRYFDKGAHVEASDIVELRKATGGSYDTTKDHPWKEY